MQVNRNDISEKDCREDIETLRAHKRHLKIDAGETVTLARELLYQRLALKNKQYPEHKGRLLAPVSNEIDSGAEEHSYKSYDRTGKAELTNNYSTKSPRLDVFLAETIGKIKGVRGHYGWSIQDLRRAAMTGRPLQSIKASSARDAIEEALDYAIAFGVDGTALTGLLNNADASSASLPHGSWVLGTTTGDEMIEDIDFVVNKMIDDTNEIEKPDTVILPPLKYAIFSSTLMGVSSHRTALKTYLENATYIKNVVSWYRTKTAGGSGATRMVVYKRDPEKLVADIPQEFEQFAPEINGMEYTVECHARTAGVSVFYPKSISYADNV